MSTSRSSKQILTAGRTNDMNRSKNPSMAQGSKLANRNTFVSHHGSTVGKKNYHSGGITERSSIWRSPVQIFDEAGNDVTPLPLLHVDPSLMKKTQANVIADGSVGTPTDLMSQTSASIYGATQAGTTATSVFGGGPFTRSVFTQSYDTASDSLPLDELGPPEITTFSEVRHKRQEFHEIPTEEDLIKIVDINLTETDTIWMFDMPDIRVSIESAESEEVKQSIRAYTELQKARVGNDLYAERGMNTFNEPLKLKTVNTQKIETEDAQVECTKWNMFDTYIDIKQEEKELIEQAEIEIGAVSEIDLRNEDDDNLEDEDATISRPLSPKEEVTSKTSDIAQSASVLKRESISAAQSRSRTGSVQDSKNTAGSSSILGSELQSFLNTAIELTEKEKLAQQWEELAKSDQLRDHLFLLERIINLNTFQHKQAQYRGFQSYSGMILCKNPRKITRKSGYDSPSSRAMDVNPHLDRLWSYSCQLTHERNVSCITWNKSNLDLVAVGYGQFEFTNQKPGLICCWCIKNPKYPERIFTSKQGVTALDFSSANPNLLAVGYYDGGVAVYNVRKTIDEPVLDNFMTPGKHIAPVWQLKWIEKERGSGEDRAEVLISISSDGRVCQWSIRKGLESYDVMKLKKMPTRMAGRTREKKGEAFISRYAGGMCFDFHSKDSNIYLAGTEEGYIHKCSCSHNEQYLESYQGHMGPVYTVKWSPFVPDIFLSCSADWTIKLWHQDKTRPILSFHSSTRAVNDICWSPWCSTVFASVNEGAVEIWNLATSTLDAVYSLSSLSGVKQTSVSFSLNSQCLLVGDNDGQVTVYELRNIARINEDQQEQLLRDVIKASLASQLPGPLEDTAIPDDEEEDAEEVSVAVVNS